MSELDNTGTSAKPILGIVVGVVCMVPAALAWAAGYNLIPGVILIGASGALAAAIIALPMRAVGQTNNPGYRALAAALTLIACLAGMVLQMWWANDKSPAVLFSPAERQATFNTWFHVIQLLGYGIGVFCGYAWSGRRA